MDKDLKNQGNALHPNRVIQESLRIYFILLLVYMNEHDLIDRYNKIKIESKIKLIKSKNDLLVSINGLLIKQIETMNEQIIHLKDEIVNLKK